MIAADSSVLIAFWRGDSGDDVDRLEAALNAAELMLPPAVLSEILSQPDTSARNAAAIADVPLLPLTEGFWRRTGETRARLLSMRLKARLADALIAQCCIDADVALITRDVDFRHFAAHCGLKLAA